MNKICVLLMVCFILSTTNSIANAQSDSYDQCIDNAKGVTSKMLDCINAEQAIWEKKLNENYKQAMNSLENPKDKKRLKEAQIAWIVWREKMINAILLLEGEGSLANLTAHTFSMEETKRQAERLHEVE